MPDRRIDERGMMVEQSIHADGVPAMLLEQLQFRPMGCDHQFRDVAIFFRSHFQRHDREVPRRHHPGSAVIRHIPADISGHSHFFPGRIQQQRDQTQHQHSDFHHCISPLSHRHPASRILSAGQRTPCRWFCSIADGRPARPQTDSCCSRCDTPASAGKPAWRRPWRTD